jgi:hypothetical protein
MPNPGSGLFVIRVSDAEHVTVLDVAGKLVATLSTRRGEATWDAGNAPPGVYLVRASDSKGIEARQLVRLVRPR